MIGVQTAPSRSSALGLSRQRAKSLRHVADIDVLEPSFSPVMIAPATADGATFGAGTVLMPLVIEGPREDIDDAAPHRRISPRNSAPTNMRPPAPRIAKRPDWASAWIETGCYPGAGLLARSAARPASRTEGLRQPHEAEQSKLHLLADALHLAAL